MEQDSIFSLVAKAIRSELSDFADVEYMTRLLVRLLLALFLGAVLGYDREKKGKAAGLRTHMLVCFGAAFFILVPKLSGMSDDGISRILQGLTAGIGFLGAGAILKNKEEQEISGVTTAAGIWVTAAIGVAAGLGRDSTAIIATAVVFLILALAPKE